MKEGSSLRTVLVYILMVGFPVLGIFWVLHYGQRLHPPISIKGEWSIDAALLAASAQSCLPLQSQEKQLVFTIQQSGRRFSLDLPGSSRFRLEGEITGAQLAASAPWRSAPGSSQPACGDNSQLAFTANVVNQGAQKVLTGSFSVPNCQQCPPVSFNASPVKTVKRSSAH